MNPETKTYYRILQSFLKNEAKDKHLLVCFEKKWHVAIASKSRTKSGKKYNRLARLVRRIKCARTHHV